MESRNILSSHGNGILQLVRHGINRFGYLIGSDFQAAKLHTVEPGSHFAQSHIATRAHIGDNRSHSVVQLASFSHGACH